MTPNSKDEPALVDLALRGRLAWRVHLGRAGSRVGGGWPKDRGDIRNVRRRHERSSAGGLFGRRRQRRARCFGAFLAARVAGGGVEPAATLPGGSPDGAVDARYVASLSRDGSDERVFSPYDLNLLGFNPLRGIPAETIDFDRLARSPSGTGS